MIQAQERGLARFPVHRLDVGKVNLTTNALDDYQRLYFASASNNREDSCCKTKAATYKSNIAEAFAVPFKNGEENVVYQSKQNILHCFEYQLPDVLTSKETIDSEFRNLSEKQKHNLQLDGQTAQVLKGRIVRDGEETSGLTQNSELDDISATLTKNQQFKLRKLDHNLQSNDKLINPNNCILWTKDSGYVFFTGIWRIYQDVMRGLIQVPRQGQDVQDRSLQDACMKSLSLIIDHALYENIKEGMSPISAGGGSERRKRRSSLGNELNFLNMPVTSSNSGISSGAGTGGLGNTNNSGSFPAAYTDLHWNNLVPELKIQMIEMYRNYLVNEKGISPDEIPDLTVANIVKRIRGGYIKIQGTWLPLEIARYLCTKFCFPIRYLLIPIFGENFPKECEDSFNNIQNQITNATTIIQSTGAFSDTNPVSMMSPINQYSFIPSQRRKRKSNYTTDKRRPPSHIEIPVSNAIPNTTILTRESRSFSKMPETAHFMVKKNSSEQLPPISTIMDILPNQRTSVVINDNYNQNMDQVQSSASPSGSFFVPQQVFAEPTVQTLSNLATFYTTNGHRYSYPGNVYHSHQKQTPTMEHCQSDYFDPKNTSSVTYSPTQELPSFNHMYYDGSPSNHFNPLKRNPTYWVPQTANDYMQTSNLTNNQNVAHPSTNQGSFSASR